MFFSSCANEKLILGTCPFSICIVCSIFFAIPKSRQLSFFGVPQTCCSIFERQRWDRSDRFIILLRSGGILFRFNHFVAFPLLHFELHKVVFGGNTSNGREFLSRKFSMKSSINGLKVDCFPQISWITTTLETFQRKCLVGLLLG